MKKLNLSLLLIAAATLAGCGTTTTPSTSTKPSTTTSAKPTETTKPSTSVTPAADMLKTGVAYGLTHGAGYVSEAVITTLGSKVVDATLVEVCFPTYVTAGADVAAADKVAVEVTSHGTTSTKEYYKTIKFAGKTYTFDTTDKDYKAGTTTFKADMATEANAKAYYEAVRGNEVAVVVGGEDKKDVLTWKALSKTENGYWGGTSYASKLTGYGATEPSLWLYYRNKTIDYVKANGVDALLATVRDTKNDDTNPNGTNMWKNGTVSVGATWSDLNSDTTGKGYFSYAQLLKKASDAQVGAAYGLTHGAGYVSEATVKLNGTKVEDATLVEVCFPTYVTAGADVADADKVAVEVTSHGTTSTKTYYKTIKFAGKTYTFDATAKDYKSGSSTFVADMANEENATKYYNAVRAGGLAVVVGGVEKTDVLTWDALSKTENGYWGGSSYASKLQGYGATEATVWLYYRNKTIEYVKANGVDALLATVRDTKNDDTNPNGTNMWKNGTVSVGATWSDLNSDTTGKGYYSYAQLLKAATN